jgi:hypothetical protein
MQKNTTKSLISSDSILSTTLNKKNQINDRNQKANEKTTDEKNNHNNEQF